MKMAIIMASHLGVEGGFQLHNGGPDFFQRVRRAHVDG